MNFFKQNWKPILVGVVIGIAICVAYKKMYPCPCQQNNDDNDASETSS